MKKFLKDAVSELHNVTWPTKKHAISISKITIIFTIICTIFIGGSDFILAEAYKGWASLSPKNDIKIQEQAPLIELGGENTGDATIEILPETTGTGDSI